MLDLGIETSQVFKKLIAEYLDVPLGRNLSYLRRARENLPSQLLGAVHDEDRLDSAVPAHPEREDSSLPDPDMEDDTLPLSQMDDSLAFLELDDWSVNDWTHDDPYSIDFRST